MATWEDGPEYAPLERPADFVVPAVPPLDPAPAVARLATGVSKDRPVFYDPQVPLAPLASLVPDVADPRDPQLPFDVASSMITSDSAWGALQPTAPAARFTLTDPAPAGAPWGPAAAAPWPRPDQPEGPGDEPGPSADYPAPGTPDWFGPGPYAPPPPVEPVTLRRVLLAATPGLCICLVIGGLVYVLAPILLAVALGLASRVTIAQQAVRRAFTGAVAAVGLVAVVVALTNVTGFADGWDVVGRWSQLFCWVMLAVTGGIIYRALRQPDGPGPRRATWG